MLSLQPKLQISSLPSARQRRRKRFSGRMLIGVGVTLALVLLAVVVFVFQQLTASHAAHLSASHTHNGAITTINGLQKISQVGSTANILDAHGKTIKVDPNPYKIGIAPSNLSSGLKAGDIVVSNIGNNDHGITLVKFLGQGGTGHLFNTKTDGVLGPAGLTFDHGMLLVANSTGNSVLVFRPDGTLFATIHDPLFNGPWGITSGSQENEGQSTLFSFFTANKLDAKILRVDLISQDHHAPIAHVTQIGQFDKNADATKIDLHWLPLLKVADHTWKDVILAIDPANNRIAAFANSRSLSGRERGMTVFQGKPLNMPGGFALNPLNGDLLVVNLADNNLVELNMTLRSVVGVKQIDPMAVDAQGNGSALFGVAAIRDEHGNLKVFFTDDNSNSLNVLSTS